MQRYFYSKSIPTFLTQSDEEIIGELFMNSGFADGQPQKMAWLAQINLLKQVLPGRSGQLFMEYSIPRLGRRIDVVLIIENVLFILEFKVGENRFLPSAIDQVWDYALDLKNFHETSHSIVIAPILIATEAIDGLSELGFVLDVDNMLSPPTKTNAHQLSRHLDAILEFVTADPIDPDAWEVGRYAPTPTIIEAASTLYSEHSVVDISRTDASARNLRETSAAIREIVTDSKNKGQRSICFVTGVPGAGKTLVGLNIAAHRAKNEDDPKSVFLSGNGPLVAILREALTRDKVRREKEKGCRLTKKDALRSVSKFIQNVHHYRDEYLKDPGAPYDHVAIFDEAQRAWNLAETVRFMREKKNRPDFHMSEPEFLISCLNRHEDWAVIVCLVGGGQEINRGEAGIGEWIESLNRSFPDWNIHISDRLRDSEYAAGHVLESIEHKDHVRIDDRLHLSVSMRSYRAENVSAFVKAILDMEIRTATELYHNIRHRYPLVLTRDLTLAKRWLREKARGSERFGILASSSAERLKSRGLHVKAPMNPVHWFLEGKEDVRSSYFLEDVATEFHCQGLELDWTCVAWDADLRYSPTDWQKYSFKGTNWQNVNSPARQQYLKNAYRVLLTRARQGMIVVVPHGESTDRTRLPEFYDRTFEYLTSVGLEVV